MSESIHREKVFSILEPLPSCWLRKKSTAPDIDTDTDGGVLRVGSSGHLRGALLGIIEQAKEVILAASFLFSDGDLAEALLRAAREGKRVYVLTASEERLSKLVSEDDSFETRMIDEHKKLLNRLAGKVLLRSAEHFHAKLLITDPQTPHAKGFITTANFNKALMEGVELGVRLLPKEADEAAAWFSYVFWLEAKHELADKGRFAEIKEAPRQPRSPEQGTVIATTKQHTMLRDEVMTLIGGAQRKLFVASYGFDIEHQVLSTIEAAVQRGVKVSIYTRPRPAVSDAILRLAKAGAHIFAHDKFHAKAIFSEAGAMVMSANLESKGLDEGFEMGVVLGTRESKELRRIFDEWAEQFPWVFAHAANRSEHLGEICLVDHGLKDGIREVVEEMTIDLEPVVIDASRLDEAPEPTWPDIAHLLKTPDFPRNVRCKWEIQVQSPPKKTKAVQRSAEKKKQDKNGQSKSRKGKKPRR